MPTPSPPPPHFRDEEEEPFIRGSVAQLDQEEQQTQPCHRQRQDQKELIGAAKMAAIVVDVVSAGVAVLLLAAAFLSSSPAQKTSCSNIPPACVTALGGGIVGPGGQIHMNAGRDGGSCRSALAAYAQSPDGPYWRDVDAAVGAAYAALGISRDDDDGEKGSGEQQRGSLAAAAPPPPPPRGIVVFDIDETALSNAPLFSSLPSSPSSSAPPSILSPGGSLPPLFSPDGARRVGRADAPALEPTLRLYHALQRQGLAAAFVTGRGEASRRETERNLRAAGYGGRCGATGGGGGREGGTGGRGGTGAARGEGDHEYCYLSLTLRAPGDARPASVYKPEARAAVAARWGLPVVASVGDQWSDLSGGGGEQDEAASYVAIKLPNPFYYIL